MGSQGGELLLTTLLAKNLKIFSPVLILKNLFFVQ